MHESIDSRREKWIKIDLLINPETGEMYAVSGDREPCSHGHPPCCDTEYIGLKWLKERIENGNAK